MKNLVPFDAAANSISQAKSMAQLRFSWATLASKFSRAERGNLGYFYQQRKSQLLKGPQK